MNDLLEPKTISVNGVTLNYVERGSGEPVIFVHGSLGDYHTWLPQVDAFSQQYRAISYSRRYHSPNPWSGDGTDYTVGLHADDLIGLIEALNLGPAHVVGNSFGAYTTLIAATRHPEMLRKLVIGEPPILPWLQQVPGGQAYFDAFMADAWNPAARAFQNGDMEQAVGLFIDGVSGKGTFEHIPAAPKQRMMDNARSLQAETLSPGYFTELTPQQVEQITLPMLLLKGEHSPKMFHLVVDQLARYAHNAREVAIPRASHSIPSGNPAAYNQVVLTFLQGE